MKDVRIFLMWKEKSYYSLFLAFLHSLSVTDVRCSLTILKMLSCLEIIF